MANIKYRIGQEKDIVLENGNFNDSIFKEQYANSLKLTDFLLEEIDKNSLKVISFCGERGDGKTSCMMSVANILTNSADKDSDAHKLIAKEQLKKIVAVRFEALELIDPSFFDDSHNVIELIVGQLYGTFKEKLCSNDKYEKRNELLSAFQNIKRYLCVLHDRNLDAINSMHELDVLSSTIALKKHMADLVRLYLDYIGKDVLIIPIDDIDLDVSQAYKMCEQIRKYLAVPKCVVFMGVKIDQLQSAISLHFSKQFRSSKGERKDNNVQVENGDECDLMAEKYLIKLLPTSTRIYMPKVYTFINSKIEIWRDSNTLEMHSKLLKEAIVELIFHKTRYLFYNQLDSISPIVPNNLRDFFILIGLLSVMKSVDDSRNHEEKTILESNKNVFKQYFFNVWKSRFNHDLQSKLDKLINFDFGTSFNKEVIGMLNDSFKAKLQKNYEQPKPEEFDENKTDDIDSSSFSNSDSGSSSSKGRNIEVLKTPSSIIIDSITSKETFGYNLSVGDVFYLISSLEKETLQEEEYLLLFFIKSLYSIKLYECYDAITETENGIYPQLDSNFDSLSVIDHRFDHSNKLQQLIGGAYFTYASGDLLPRLSGYPNALDLRKVEGKKINELISSVKRDIDIYMDYNEDNADDEAKQRYKDFNLRLNLAEFFIFSIKCAVRSKEFQNVRLDKSGREDMGTLLDKLRKNVDPFMYRSFNTNTGFYILDITAPFANILNPRYTYERFVGIDESTFEKILNYPHSLLYQMLSSVKRDYINHNEKNPLWTKLHRLLSDSVIRNADVLISVYDNAILERANSHDAAVEMLTQFYGKIQDSHLATQKIGDTGESYKIEFHFLNPIYELLQKIQPKLEEKKYTIATNLEPVSDLIRIIYGLNDSSITNISIPKLEEIKAAIGRARRPSSIRSNLKKKIDFFKGVNAYLLDFFKVSRLEDISFDEDQFDVKLNEFYQFICNKIGIPDDKIAEIVDNDGYIDNRFSESSDNVAETTTSEPSDSPYVMAHFDSQDS